MMRVLTLSGGVLAGGLAFGFFALTPAQALTSKECHAQYTAAKKAGQTMKYAAYRKANCEAPAAAASTSAAKPSAMKAASPAPVASGRVVFPSKIDPKYSKDSAGKARRETCRDQYAANKATNANGGLKWIQKGGGYYSECNKKLKS